MNDVALQTPNAQLRDMKLLSWIIVNPINGVPVADSWGRRKLNFVYIDFVHFNFLILGLQGCINPSETSKSVIQPHAKSTQ